MNIEDLILKLETKTDRIVKLETSLEKIQSQPEDRLLLQISLEESVNTDKSSGIFKQESPDVVMLSVEQDRTKKKKI